MYCPQCGAPKHDASIVCAACGFRDVPPSQSLADDPTMRMLLPVGRSVYAIIAGYLGLVSVLFFPAPFALLFGILGLRDIKKHPELGGKGRAIFGLVMGLIFTLLIAALIVAAMLGQ